MGESRQEVRHLHLQPAALGLVAAGGAVGTLLRAGVATAMPVEPGRWPWATLVVNLIGALLLGLLLESLAARGPDTGRRRQLRLLLGTGLMGGFTTYSALAVETTRLVESGHPFLGVAYLAVSMVLGIGAAAAGMAWGRRRSQSRGTA